MKATERPSPCGRSARARAPVSSGWQKDGTGSTALWRHRRWTAAGRPLELVGLQPVHELRVHRERCAGSQRAHARVREAVDAGMASDPGSGLQRCHKLEPNSVAGAVIFMVLDNGLGG